MSEFMRNLDNVGKPVWIVLMILGFVFFWPVGLAVFVYMVWAGKFGKTIWFPWARSFWSSGNQAFDEHHTEVLRKLQDERDAFDKFIDDLSKAKDKSEFDNFMNARNQKA